MIVAQLKRPGCRFVFVGGAHSAGRKCEDTLQQLRFDLVCAETHSSDRKYWPVQSEILACQRLYGDPGERFFCVDRNPQTSLSRLQQRTPFREFLMSHLPSQREPKSEGSLEAFVEQLETWRRRRQEALPAAFHVLHAEREELMVYKSLLAAEAYLTKHGEATGLTTGILCGASHVSGISALLSEIWRSERFWEVNEDTLPLLAQLRSTSACDEEALLSTLTTDLPDLDALPLQQCGKRLEQSGTSLCVLQRIAALEEAGNATMHQVGVLAVVSACALMGFASYKVDMWLFRRKKEMENVMNM